MRDDALLTSDQGRKLKVLAASTGEKVYDLIPDAIRHKGGGTVNRYLRLLATDAKTTDVLSYLSSRTTIRNMQAEFKQSGDSKTATGDYAQASRTEMLKQALASMNIDEELGKLLAKYPDPGDRFQIECLARLIGEDEVEHYRAALKLGSTQTVSRGKSAVR